ncbi:MAG: hypothetical protein AAF499_02375, partial [Pseudomonadota bacterium]
MKHNKNKTPITFSTIALAMGSVFGVAAPAQAVSLYNTIAASASTQLLIETSANDADKAAIQAHIDLISGGERLWNVRVLTQLVYEAHLRGDLILESDLDALVKQTELKNVDTAVTGAVVDFMHRHGFEATDAKRLGEELVASLQSSTLDQFFAAHLESVGVVKNLQRALARYNAVAKQGD